MAERLASIVGIIYSRKLFDQASEANFGSGFGAKTISQIAGTESYGVAHSTEQLKTMIANAKAVDLWLGSNGKVRFVSNSTGICETLAVSVASLDLGQSDAQFLDSVQEVEKYFVRRYARFGGIEPEKRILELELK